MKVAINATEQRRSFGAMLQKDEYIGRKWASVKEIAAKTHSNTTAAYCVDHRPATSGDED